MWNFVCIPTTTFNLHSLLYNGKVAGWISSCSLSGWSYTTVIDICISKRSLKQPLWLGAPVFPWNVNESQRRGRSDLRAAAFHAVVLSQAGCWVLGCQVCFLALLLLSMHSLCLSQSPLVFFCLFVVLCFFLAFSFPCPLYLLLRAAAITQPPS